MSDTEFARNLRRLPPEILARVLHDGSVAGHTMPPALKRDLLHYTMSMSRMMATLKYVSGSIQFHQLERDGLLWSRLYHLLYRYFGKELFTDFSNFAYLPLSHRCFR
jgi:hypothetical protein